MAMTDEIVTGLEMKISYLATIGTLGPMIGLIERLHHQVNPPTYYLTGRKPVAWTSVSGWRTILVHSKP